MTLTLYQYNRNTPNSKVLEIQTTRIYPSDESYIKQTKIEVSCETIDKSLAFYFDFQLNGEKQEWIVLQHDSSWEACFAAGVRQIKILRGEHP